MTEPRAGTARSAPTRLARAAWEYGALYGSLLLLALLCLGWSLLAVPLHALLPPGAGRRLGRWGIFGVFRLFACWLTAIGAYRLDLHALDALRGEGALILAPNHPSLIDAILIAAWRPDLACIMKAELMGNILLGPGARLARYIRNGTPRRMVREAVAELRRGGVVLLFPRARAPRTHRSIPSPAAPA